MRALLLVTSLLASTALSAAQPQPAPRFAGSANLSAPLPQSSDKRFALDAQLQANHSQSAGRFVLNARLMPDAKALAAVCGPLPEEIFRDGFEGP